MKPRHPNAAVPSRGAARLALFVPAIVSLPLYLCRSAPAQEFPSPAQRIADLEKTVQELEDRVRDLERAERGQRQEVDRAKLAEGIVTLGGGAELRLGGRMEVLFIDTESDALPGLGANFVTDEPDPHLELQRLRLVPVIDLNRWISVHGQIDFRPTDGDTILRELVARYDAQPTWWFGSRLQVGLDDRFVRPARRTKGYPPTGNAFWRDESVALTWGLRFGDPRGEAAAKADGDGDGGRRARTAAARGAAGTEGFADGAEPDDSSTVIADEGPSPFDFASNWGELDLFLSLGQGYELASNEVGVDRAKFNDIVQDDRSIEDDLALRELGIGLGWNRDFGPFGELGVLGFYYDDELRGTSIGFLQGPEMTMRLPDNTPVAGYGDSEDETSRRWGVGADYFLPAKTIVGAFGLSTRARDGLRLRGEWIRGDDGELEREGWYAQGSYRFSFERLVAKRYFRSFEPLVRYGVLEVDVPLGRDVSLPGTWDRTALVVGGILEVTAEIFFKVEYTFHGEESGGPDVDNDELLVELLITFG